MKRNLEAMKDLLRWAEAGGDQGVRLDMRYWVRESSECGTTMCMGGYVVAKHGAELVEWVNRPTLEVQGTLYLDCVVNGRIRRISSHAQEILGLGEFEANLLFAGNEDLEPEQTAARSIDFLKQLIEDSEAGSSEHMSENDVDDWDSAWQAEHLS